MQWLFFCMVLIGGVPGLARATTPGAGSTVSKEKFQKVVKILIDTVKRTESLEEQVNFLQEKVALQKKQLLQTTKASPEIPSRDDSESDALRAEMEHLQDSTDARAKQKQEQVVEEKGNSYPPSLAKALGIRSPEIKLFFDFYLMSQPGGSSGGDGLTFTSLHNFVLIESVASPDIRFIGEIRTDPRFLELDYQAIPWLQIRLGKIWIPYDDIIPHNLFGGRTNIARLQTPGASPYLPDIWTDLGIGTRFTIVDRRALAVEAHTYLVNGFSNGGVDPKGQNPNNSYPSFADSVLSSRDNNRAKSFGTRIHGLFSETIGIGTSFYQGKWGQPGASERLQILGADAQAYFGDLSIRAAYTNFYVHLPLPSTEPKFQRPGYYIEGSWKFGARKEWKLVLSGGAIDGDNRVVDVNDQEIYQGKILYKPNNLEWGLEYSEDIKKVVAKSNHSLAAIRVLAQF